MLEEHQLGSWKLGHIQTVDSPDTRPVNAFRPAHIQALDSLDTEGNLGT